MVSAASILTLTATVRTALFARTAPSTARSDTADTARGKEGDTDTHIDDWRDIMKGMDRRSLYAVFSNAGGQFSEAERGAAENLMHEDYWRTLGVDVNDTSQGEDIARNAAKYMNKAVKFWDSVSDEEKQSPLWAFNRARSQHDYEMLTTDQGGTPENLDTDHPLASVIKSAMTAASLLDPSLARSRDNLDTVEGLLGQTWATGFEEQIKQAAKASTQTRGGFLNGVL